MWVSVLLGLLWVQQFRSMVVVAVELVAGEVVAADELADLIGAVDDRLEVEADLGRRARLLRGRARLERELSDLLAA